MIGLYCSMITPEKHDCFEATSLATNFLICVFTFLMFVATYRLVVNGRASSHCELRAYIAFQPGTLVFQANDDVIEGALIPVVNFGVTPAMNVNFVFSACLSSIAATSSPELQLALPTENISYDWSIPPSETVKISLPIRHRLSDVEMRSMAANELKLFIWGSAFYADVFGTQRETKFCFFIQGSEALNSMTATQAGRAIPGQPFFNYGIEHNVST